MKWFVVVIFYTIHGDVYIFTDPTFDTKQECIASVKDQQMTKRYVQKLVFEFGRLLPIQAINCLEEKTIKNILNSSSDT